MPRPDTVAKRLPFARKSLGQHFLIDRNILERIVAAAAIEPADHVLEIGAGAGALTHKLASLCARLTAVEIDDRMIAPLRAALPDIEVTHADVLDVDLSELARRHGRPLVIVGNLPYQISSPLLFKLLAERTAWSRAILMLQREVAIRMSAKVGSKDYGVLAARLGASASIESLFDVSPNCFRPRPKVVSRVIRLRPLGVTRNRAPDAIYAQVVKAAFGQRRKTLGNALRPLVMASTLQSLEIDPGRRGETLSVEEFDRIACHLAGIA